MYLVIQKHYTVFGKGETAEQAWEDAKEWMDKDDERQDLTVDDLPSLAGACDGEFCIVHTDDMNQDDVELYA